MSICAVRVRRVKVHEGHGLGDLVVERNVRYQVADQREGLQRRQRDRLAGDELLHACHALEPRPSVDLRAAGAALSGFAVPAHGQILRLPRLQLVHDVEDDHAVLVLDLVLDVLAVIVAAPDTKMRCRHG
jgi:hypothetical protein